MSGGHATYVSKIRIGHWFDGRLQLPRTVHDLEKSVAGSAPATRRDGSHRPRAGKDKCGRKR